MLKIIDLRSDTVTRPSAEMLEFMIRAEVGDDVLGDDPTVKALESKMAKMFGKDDAIFCPSGTMTNQIAVKTHTQPGNEIICDVTSHVYKFEGGGIGFNSGCSVKLIHGDQGRIKAGQVKECLNPPDNVHYPLTRLVVAENTTNIGGGSIYAMKDLVEIAEVCKEFHLSFHLDGARLFNALVETGEKPEDYGRIFDSISICFSKGLGAPVGSVLIGGHEFITKARRIRKIFGGGMRQSGFLAAAAIFAIDHNVGKLKEDHRRAKEIANFLKSMNYIQEIIPPQTNIIVVKLNERYKQAEFLNLLNEKGLWAVGFGTDMVRFVTHLDFNDEMLSGALEVFNSLS